MVMISLAIPTYNSSGFVLKSFEKVLDDPRIDEIILCDDASEDFDALLELVCQLSSPKLKLFRNEKNLKAFRNKNKAVSHCQCDWVILLDSDNILDSLYIDAWMKELPWDPQVLYLPDYAKPHFDYRFLAGQRLGIEDVILLFSTEAPPLPNGIKGSLWGCLMNGGNYAFSRDEYLATHAKHSQIEFLISESYGVDVWHFLVLWLKRGLTLKVVPNMSYEHTLRATAWSNSFLEEKHQAANILSEILWDDSFKIV